MTDRCSACGADVLEDAAFCSQCGRVWMARPAAALDVVADAVEQRGQNRPPEVTPTSGQPANGRRPAAWPLQEDEQLLWDGGYSAKAMLGGWLLAALVTVITIVVAIPVLGLDRGLFLGLLCGSLCFGGIGLYVMYLKLSVRYTLTSQRFVRQVGLLGCVTDRMEMIDADDVAFSQRPLQRMAGVGTIKIMSGGRSHPELFLHGIDRVAHVARLIDDARRVERRRRGLFIEIT